MKFKRARYLAEQLNTDAKTIIAIGKRLDETTSIARAILWSGGIPSPYSQRHDYPARIKLRVRTGGGPYWVMDHPGYGVNDEELIALAIAAKEHFDENGRAHLLKYEWPHYPFERAPTDAECATFRAMPRWRGQLSRLTSMEMDVCSDVRELVNSVVQTGYHSRLMDASTVWDLPWHDVDTLRDFGYYGMHNAPSREEVAEAIEILLELIAVLKEAKRKCLILPPVSMNRGSCPGRERVADLRRITESTKSFRVYKMYSEFLTTCQDGEAKILGAFVDSRHFDLFKSMAAGKEDGIPGCEWEIISTTTGVEGLGNRTYTTLIGERR